MIINILIKVYFLVNLLLSNFNQQQQQKLSSICINEGQSFVDENKLLLEQLILQRIYDYQQQQLQQQDIPTLNTLATANNTNLNENNLISTNTSSVNDLIHQLFYNLENENEILSSDLLALNIAQKRNINQFQVTESSSGLNFNHNVNLCQQNSFNNTNLITNNETNQPSTSFASVGVQNKIQGYNLSNRQTSSDRLLTSAESVSLILITSN